MSFMALKQSLVSLLMLFAAGLRHRASPTSVAGQAIKPLTVGLAFAAYGLSPVLSASLLVSMGCEEDDPADVLAAAPQEEITDLIKGVVVGDECRVPTFFEKGALHSFFKKLRTAFEDPHRQLRLHQPRWHRSQSHFQTTATSCSLGTTSTRR